MTQTKLPLFAYIKASLFFPAYAPGVKNWQNKLYSSAHHVTFSEPDKQAIREGLQRMVDDEGGKV